MKRRNLHGAGTLVPLMSYKDGTEVPTTDNIAINGTEVPAPERKNGTEVPTPKIAPRRFLSHANLIGYYQFITFRTHDSIDDYLRRVRSENISNKEKEYKIDQYIDLSSKGCYLNGDILEYLKEFFIGKDKSFYDLVAFCVMPNHVHILFKQNDELPKIMKILKGSSSFAINKILKRKGIFWEENYYDRAIRDENHFNTVYDYIKYNPIKAELLDSKERFYSVYE